MKTKFLFPILVIVALAAAGGWFAAKHWPEKKSTAADGREIRYYQSPMHPWIKSDQPGRCTICGMSLVAVFKGEKGFDADARLVTLGSNAIQVIHVQSEEVKRRPLHRTLRVAGVIDDNDTAHRRLSAYADGRIEKLHVNFAGAEVVAGQPLATLYSPALLAVESEYLTVLRQPAAATPAMRAEHERMLQSAAQRLIRLGYAEAQVTALAKKNSADARTEILAPMTGTVVERKAYEGQYVKEGEVLFEIADFSKMWFRFDAYERDLGWLKPGQLVEITTPALSGKTFSAPITFIDPNLNDTTRSAKVRVELENPLVERDGQKRRELLHRLWADGAVQLEIPEVLAVPRSAVLSPGAQAVAYVDQGGGGYEQRKLKLGRLGDDAWEVLAGLSPGERVVTAGNMLIDAQAQLNQSANPVAAPPVVGSTLTEAQQKGVGEFLAAVSGLGGALAADKLEAFNQQAAQFHLAMPALLGLLAQEKSWQPALQKIEAAAHLEKAGTLVAARKEFLPLSLAVVDFAKALRAQQATSGPLKIFQCPMTDKAIPGAAKISFWIQLDGPTKNPFFGSEMLDCGTEVKP